jgi:hypothetical protein
MTTILVEGCDGSGKSTLIEHARGNQKDHYFIKAQASRYQPSVKDALKYLAWVKQCPHDLVLDRLHFISDRVYGPILREVDVFKDFPISFGVQSMDAVVYCRPPKEIIIANLSNNKHLAGVTENIEAIIAKYDEIIGAITNMQIAPVYNYDYIGDDPVSFWRHVWSRTKGK